MKTNQISLQGKLVKMAYRAGVSKAGKEFVSATFTLDVNGDRINAETFAMKMKADGSDESGAYKSLMTLWNESKALQKTYKKQGEEKPVEVENETIVENIEDTTAIKMSNWNGFKYCKFVENNFVSATGEQVKNTRIEFAYPNRMDDENYEPKADFEIAGKVKTAPCMMEKPDGTEYIQFVVTVPEYIEAWKDRPEQVKLQDITVTSYDKDAWNYIEDNFTMGSFAYLNGEIVRKIMRVEKPTIDDEGRGFGRKLKQNPEYDTKIDERFEIMGGYVLEEDELELEKAFNEELWLQAEQQQPKQEKTPEVKKTWGREETKSKEETKPRNDDIVPF